ncbi:heavy-metal-associated domain-containing protein [Xylophilus sp. GOD-11R]|uniref:heavy-metal-associated domain-containing protein n=1 Tax=Xylophilus sp. GOD-11R TaxID=3089814 RepID=UPI00298C2A57|nr:heavy-metal-associated domain-containing protein [Xylophilus sp. GOD-11R]WPB57028.1 heavy-metal-associated domain-containing protein [Xylophilus sp. GOD-11R]
MQEQFKVEGMSCQHCVRAVTQAIEDLDPSAEVTVDLADGRVDVTAASQPREAIRQAIQEAGYQAA